MRAALLGSRWTGAQEPAEVRRVWRCFAAVALLLLSYYLVKPLRNSQFLKDFAPADLPWIYLVVSFVSVFLTRIFQICSDRFSRRAVVGGTFAWAIACKLFFWQALARGGHTVTWLFYLWASVYFLLLTATMWGCFNERFRSEQAERCFPFIYLGATVGTILGAQLANWTAHWGYNCLIGSAVALALSLVCLWPEFSFPVRASLRWPADEAKPSAEKWSRDPTLRAIGFMVLALAIYTTATELATQRLLDRQVGRKVFTARLTPLSSAWHYEQFSEIRQLKGVEQRGALQALAQEHGVPPSRLATAYAAYQDEREAQLRQLFASISEGQGLLGIVLLGLICRPFVKRFGVGTAVIVMPTFALCVLPMLVFPLDVPVVQGILILGGALNYSFNNATKEMLYTATSRSAIVKGKPFIEGPLMRFGDVFCAVLTLSTAALVARAGWKQDWADYLTLGCCFAFTLFWWRAVRRAGSAYRSTVDRVVDHVENA